MITIKPDWPAPKNIAAFATTRCGGRSEGRFEGLNIARHVGDAPETVSDNRRLLLAELPRAAVITWLNQAHGTSVVCADACGGEPDADASWTGATGVVCAVMTADCLPVLFCSAGGGKVAAAHAGWRGLSAGVLEATVAAMGGDPSSIMAWLGPAIGPAAFEVGAEVRDQFLAQSGASSQAAIAQCFTASATGSDFFLADLFQLARVKLAGIGVDRVYGGGLCTFTHENRFYSYRRDGETGRMATLILKTSS